jgi:sulfotransferase family protein
MPVIVGVPRSGTTLLRIMLDAHSALAIPPETGFLPRLAALDGVAGEGRAAVEAITGSETWSDFHLDATAFESEVARLVPCTPADVARTFYRMYASRFGKARWGDKTPTYGTEIDRIAGLLPEAHILHIIRDGRDVMLSVRGLWFRPGDTVEACAEDWARRLARTREIGHRLSRYLEVRYEALVTSCEATLERICGFLDLAFEPGMLRYHERAGSRLDEHEARYAADGRLVISKAERRYNQRHVMEPPQPDRVDRWRQEATGDELRRFEAVAGEWLDQLGYVRASRRM